LIDAQTFEQELSQTRFYAIISFEVVAHSLYFSSRLIAANNLTEVYYYRMTTSLFSPTFLILYGREFRKRKVSRNLPGHNGNNKNQQLFRLPARQWLVGILQSRFGEEGHRPFHPQTPPLLPVG
jgi:hypothetical protein